MIHQGFDFADLFVAHRLVMREVKTRFSRVHQRAFLLHMCTQHLAQRLVHQMRGRVIAHGTCAARGIHFCGKLVADGERACGQFPVMAKYIQLNF